MDTNVIVIGVTGPSASGKSLLASTIVKELASEKVSVISEDSYYKDQKNLPLEEREKTNYDHPNALEHDLLVEHLHKLRQGIGVHIPMYDYTQHNRSDLQKYVTPSTIIVLEGILLFIDQKLRDLMNIKIYMDTSLDLCLLRRIQRDVLNRGRNIESVINQYQQTVRPMFFQFIEPSKKHADLIVPNGGRNRVAIDVIKAKMRELLSNSNERQVILNNQTNADKIMNAL